MIIVEEYQTHTNTNKINLQISEIWINILRFKVFEVCVIYHMKKFEKATLKKIVDLEWYRTSKCDQ